MGCRADTIWEWGVEQAPQGQVRIGTRDSRCRWRRGRKPRGQWGWGGQAVDSVKGEGVSTYGDWPVA